MTDNIMVAENFCAEELELHDDAELLLPCVIEDNQQSSLPASGTNSLSTQDSFSQYFNAPYLSEAEEQALAHDFVEKGCLKAAHTLVMAHMRYVVKIARGYMGYGLPLNEMVQEGALGLMKAVKKFNPIHGVRLVSFAVYWIKAEIHEYIIKNWRLVKIATTKAQRKLFFNYRRIKEQKRETPFADLHADIAGELNVPIEEVNLMRARLSEKEVQFDQPIGNDSKLTLGDIVPSSEQNPEDMVVDSDRQEFYQHKLPAAFDYLNAREQDIIRARFFEEDKITLKDLADKYNISVERVRQLEKNALNRLKTVLQEAE